MIPISARRSDAGEGKDGSRTWHTLSGRIGGPKRKRKTRKEATKEQENEADPRFGVFLLQRRVEVARGLVNSLHFHEMRESGVLV